MLLIALLTVLSIAPSSDCAQVHPCADEEYYEARRSASPSCRSTAWSFDDKLNACKEVLCIDYFKAQSVDILNATDEEMYAELKRSNFYAKYQPDNKTLLENPYARLKIVLRKNVLENFRITSAREHFLREFAITCLVRGTAEPHDVQPFFLSMEYDPIQRYVFVYNQREEIVVVAKAKHIY